MSTAEGQRTIADVLAQARSRPERLTPEQAEAAYARGAVVVDIRPAASLQDLGIHRATDVIGGYAAWRAL